MAEINDLNITDASNTTRWPENMAPSAVNNAGRADEGLLARWHKDTNASKASTGSANAYVFAADQTLSAYYDGLVIAFDANFENTGAATLNVDAVSADTIKKRNDQDLVAGDIEAGQKVWVVHDGTNWQMMTPTAQDAGLGDANIFTASQLIDRTGAGGSLVIGSDQSSSIVGEVRFRGHDAGGNDTRYGDVRGRVADATEGSEDGEVIITVARAGAELSNVAIFGPGGIYTPGATGGDQGVDTINASGIYEDGVQITAAGVAKAWVSFNGTGVLAIRSSYNVSGVVDNGVGDYTISWDTDFAAADYAVTGFARSDDTISEGIVSQDSDDAYAVGSIQISVNDSGSTKIDSALVCVTAFGDQ